jgi:hypothetical protein
LMGCMRSSNSAEGRNFHLRMMVQMRATPPMLPAMAPMTAKLTLVVFETLLAGAGEAVLAAAEFETTLVTSI